jgi:hypothetical protein
MPVYGGRRTRAGAPSSEADPGRGRGGPSSEADPRARRSLLEGEQALERGGARSREARTLE